MQRNRSSRVGRAPLLAGLAVVVVVLPLWVGTAQAPREAQPANRGRIAVVLAPRRKAVLSAEVSAGVVQVHRELGEPFECGALLVRLDDLVYRANRDVAAARLEAAEQELEQAKALAAARARERHAEAVLEAARANFKATQRLYDDGQASLVDLENARRDVRTAEADCELVAATSAKALFTAQREVAAARGRLAVAADELEACTIVAPYAGRVARLRISEHELVDRGTPIIEVVDDHVLRAKLLLPSALFRSVQLGQAMKLTVSETGREAVAKVSHIAAVLDPASATFEVYAEVDNADGALRAGMNGWLSLDEFGRR